MKKHIYFLLSVIAVMALFTSCTDEPVSTTTVTDIDGNVYHTVTIGTQTWMVENLKTTRLNDGTAIPNVMDNTEWTVLITPGYCWYDNDPTTYENTFGALYNGYAVSTGKLAPTGWHVATNAEWTTLQNYVSTNLGTSTSLAKALAATSYWSASTAGGAIGNDLTINNSTGFTAFSGGYRMSVDGSYNDILISGNWWCSTFDEFSGGSNLYFSYLLNSNNNVVNSTSSISDGYSVRCVKD